MTNHGFPKLVQCSNQAEFSLSGRIITIGSAKECHIYISDMSIPGRAVHLLFAHGKYTLQKLSHDIEVTVNNVSVRSTISLCHGTELAIGKHIFHYLESNDNTTIPTKGKSDEDQFLHELLIAITSLLGNKGDNVFNDLVFSVSKLLKSDASRLVQEDPLTGNRNTISRYPKNTGLNRFSSRAIEWAKEESQTILLHDIDWKESNDSVNSLDKNFVSSVLCAPLQSEGTIFGYLYLDRLQNNGTFIEKDREFLNTLVPLFAEILKNHVEYERQRMTIERFQNELLHPASCMIYESEKMHDTIQLAMKLAKTESPILILGETGTGKEVVSRFVHEHSLRSDKPFIAINCGAIPENLMESELFGHEKGAFTGATVRKTGLFEEAHGGTLLLDEIGELPLQLQVKLLRVLQESEINRVGGSETISINVRILAATNKNLEKEIVAGNFREDLYYRLNVLAIELPALRERDHDVLLLADYFIKKYSQQFGLSQKILSTQAQKVILAYAWPGNIRELENCMQKTILLSSGEKILPEHIQIRSQSNNSTVTELHSITPLKEARNKAEFAAIVKAIEKSKGNVSLASTMLKIDRKWLMKKMKEFDIKADNYR